MTLSLKWTRMPRFETEEFPILDDDADPDEVDDEDDLDIDPDESEAREMSQIQKTVSEERRLDNKDFYRFLG